MVAAIMVLKRSRNIKNHGLMGKERISEWKCFGEGGGGGGSKKDNDRISSSIDLLFLVFVDKTLSTALVNAFLKPISALLIRFILIYNHGTGLGPTVLSF